MMKPKRTYLVLAILSLILAGPAALPAGAIFQEPFINYSTLNNTLIINTMYYDATYNATAGGFTLFNVTNDLEQTYSVVGNSSLPLLALKAGGEVLRNGEIQVLGSSEDKMLMLEATYSTANGTIRIILTFYSWSPLIAVYIDATSYNGTYKIVLPLEEAPDFNVSTVYTFSSEGNITTKIVTGTGTHTVNETEIPIAVSLIGLKPTANRSISNSSIIAGLALNTPQPVRSISFSEATINNTTTRIVELEVIGGSDVQVDLLATNYIPAALGIPPFAVQLGALVNIDTGIGTITQLDTYIKQLKDRIDSLNSTVKNLRDRVKELQQKLDYYKGCEDHYKQEIKARDYQISQLKNRLEKTGAIEAGVFIVGIILGIIGSAYILNIRK